MEAVHHNFYAMGTRLDLVIPSPPGPLVDEFFHEVRTEVADLERQLSRFDPEGAVSFLNQNAFKRPFLVDPPLFEILSRCMEYHRRALGFFDITMRPLMEMYRGGASPAGADYRHLHSRLGMDKIELHAPDGTVFFQNDRISLDFGGIGKGIALDRVKTLTDRYPFPSVFVSFGESSIYAHGSHPYGDCWKVGIQSLYDWEASAFTFELKNRFLSTSGPRPVSAAGRGDLDAFHIVNPCTGEIFDRTVTCSVAAASAADAEVLSTALLVAGKERAQEIVDQFQEVEAVEISYSASGFDRIGPYRSGVGCHD